MTAETDTPTGAARQQEFVVKPKLPPLTPGSQYKMSDIEDIAVQGTPVYLDLGVDGMGVVAGYDTTGDGFVDSLDSNLDGFRDKTLFVDFIIEQDPLDQQAKAVFEAIDTDANGQISKFDLIEAMKRNQGIDDFVLKDIDGSRAFADDTGKAFEAVEAIFVAISGGALRIQAESFIEYFSNSRGGAYQAKCQGGHPLKAFVADNDGCRCAKCPATRTFLKGAHLHGCRQCDYNVCDACFMKSIEATEDSNKARSLFAKIDVDHSGMLSKHELLGAVQEIPELSKLLFPDAEGETVKLSEDVWDKIDNFFQLMSGGKKWVFFEDFATFYSIHVHPPGIIETPEHTKINRGSKTVLIIGPGFGRELNPAQSALVLQSGYNIQWVLDIPNPEVPGFQMQQHLGRVTSALGRYKPDLLICASKGWMYVVALWNVGIRNFATLMINCHPSITALPTGQNIVIAAGSNDELYARDRESMESTMAKGLDSTTDDYKKRCLYWACNSGSVNGGYSRYGDKHNMESLLNYNLLPRLMDVALSKCPENEIIFSWREALAHERILAEENLSGHLVEWGKKWDTAKAEIRQEVVYGTPECDAVVKIFNAAPVHPANYNQQTTGQQIWSQTQIRKIERVQNAPLLKGAQTYYKKLEDLFQDGQGLEFAPNVHTRWLFHGTDAWEAIINDPITGFQPLASGSRLGSLWGAGTYFARDAKYVAESNFCKTCPDGCKRMLLCLVTIGIPCVGASAQKGILPYRNGQMPYKYNSTVDSLSSPEIFISQQPSAAYPAYVITFQ